MSLQLYETQKPQFIQVDDFLYPVTHWFIVKEQPVKEGFQFVVRGVAGQSRQYWTVGSMPNYLIDFGDGTITRYGPASYNGVDFNFNTAHTYQKDGEYVITASLVSSVELSQLPDGSYPNFGDLSDSGYIFPNDTWLEILTPLPSYEGSNNYQWAMNNIFNRWQAPLLRKVCGKLFSNNSHLNSAYLILQRANLTTLPPNVFEGLGNITATGEGYSHALQGASITKLTDRMFSYSPMATNFAHLCQGSNLRRPAYEEAEDPSQNMLQVIEGDPWAGLHVDNFRNAFQFQLHLQYCPPLWERYPESKWNEVGHGCFEGCYGASNYDEVPYPWRLTDRGGGTGLSFAASILMLPIPTTNTTGFTNVVLTKTGNALIGPLEWYFRLLLQDPVRYEDRATLDGFTIEIVDAYSITLSYTNKANETFALYPGLSAITLCVRGEILSGLYQGDMITASVILRKQS